MPDDGIGSRTGHRAGFRFQTLHKLYRP